MRRGVQRIKYKLKRPPGLTKEILRQASFRARRQRADEELGDGVARNYRAPWTSAVEGARRGGSTGKKTGREYLAAIYQGDGTIIRFLASQNG